jgi:hypothetical protein
VGTPHPRSPKILPITGERLDSWKEIARYLNRGSRTVQRLEETSGLPIYPEIAQPELRDFLALLNSAAKNRAVQAERFTERFLCSDLLHGHRHARLALGRARFERHRHGGTGSHGLRNAHLYLQHSREPRR